MADDDSQDQLNQHDAAGQEIKGHPAWQEILDVIPDELHHLVKPTLAKWDKGVQEKIESLHNKYEPYKDLVDNNVEMDQVNQAISLWNEIYENPSEVVKNVIDAFELDDYVPKDSLPEESETLEMPETSNTDYSGDPQLEAITKQLQALQDRFEQQDKESEEEREQREFEEYLTELEQNADGPFDKTYVTALISQGIDGAKAVKQYQDIVSQAAAELNNAGNDQEGSSPENSDNAGEAPTSSTTESTVPTAPVVMGNSGTVGSGVPDDSVRMGDLGKNEVNDLVEKILSGQAQA